MEVTVKAPLYGWRVLITFALIFGIPAVAGTVWEVTIIVRAVSEGLSDGLIREWLINRGIAIGLLLLLYLPVAFMAFLAYGQKDPQGSKGSEEP